MSWDVLHEFCICMLAEGRMNELFNLASSRGVFDAAFVGGFGKSTVQAILDVLAVMSSLSTETETLLCRVDYCMTV